MTLKKDHYDKLPSMACEILERIKDKYGENHWFEEAWNEYRAYVLKTPAMKLRMPGYVFKKYVKPNERPKQKPPDVIKHYGIQGQKWGVRRFQNPDGSLVNPKKSGVKTDRGKKDLAKKVAIGLGATAVAAGIAYMGTKHMQGIKARKAAEFIAESKKIMSSRQRTMKAQRTKAARKAVGYYKNYKTGINYSKMAKPNSSFNAAMTFVNKPAYMNTTAGQLLPGNLRI